MIIEKNGILGLCERLAQGLDDTTITEDFKYFISFTATKKKFCLGLHYNGSNRFLYFNGVKLYQFKAKDSHIKLYPLYLDNVLLSLYYYGFLTEINRCNRYWYWYY